MLIWAICLAFLAAAVVNLIRHVPLVPKPEGDTQDYITLAAHRPPLYGWLLAGYGFLFGGLRLLPLLQLVMLAAGLLVFAGGLASLLGSALAGVIASALVLTHVQIHDSPAYILSEPLFLCMIMAGLGLQFRYARTSGAGCLFASMLCFGLATDTRTTGAIFLLIPVLCALFDPRLRLATAVMRAGKCTAIGAMLVLLAMAGNWAEHGSGYFNVGNAAGESLLGKAMVTLAPSDLAGLPPAAAPILPFAEAGRRIIAAQPGWDARVLTETQDGWDLKYTGFYDEADRIWPAFRQGDRQHKNWLMKPIADKLIRAHPLAYLALVRDSWLGLILYPSYWPDWMTPPVTGKAGPLLCAVVHHRCFLQVRYNIGTPHLFVLLAVSLTGTVSSLLLLLFGSWRVLRRNARPELVAFWALSLVLQGSLFATAFTEQPLTRYTEALHVLGVALLIWLTTRELRPGGRTA